MYFMGQSRRKNEGEGFEVELGRGMPRKRMGGTIRKMGLGGDLRKGRGAFWRCWLFI